jgi:hypothetical protein
MASDTRVAELLNRWTTGRAVDRVEIDGGYTRVYLNGEGSPWFGLFDAVGDANSLPGQVLGSANVNDSGALRLESADRVVITCAPHPTLERWELHAEGTILLLCLPGGDVVEWVRAAWWELLLDRVLSRFQR